MRVLLVDPDTASIPNLIFTNAGYPVTHATDAETGKAFVENFDFDMIVISEPTSLLLELRREKVDCPIIIVGADDALSLFSAGADDVCTDLDLLLPRAKALHRIACKAPGPILEAGNLTLNTASRQVIVGGAEVHLTKMELLLLETLLLNRQRVLTAREIHSRIYTPGDYEPDLPIISVFMVRIRKKLADAGWAGATIRNSKGQGYRIV